MSEEKRCCPMCGKLIRKLKKKYCCGSCGKKYRQLKKTVANINFMLQIL